MFTRTKKLCSCCGQYELFEDEVKTEAGVALIVACPECDRKKCQRCKRALGDFFRRAPDSCPFCGDAK